MDQVQQFFANEVLPNLQYERLLADYNPTDKGNHFVIDCPLCRQHEAYIYKDTGAATCNRKNECKYSGNIFSLLNQGNKPTGTRYIEIMKQLFESIGKDFPKKEYTAEEVAIFQEHDHKQKLFHDFLAITIEALSSPAGTEALNYLNGRGLSGEAILNNHLGFYPNNAFIKQELEKKSYLPNAIHESGVFRSDWDGRIILPIKERGVIGDFIAGDITRTAPDEKKYLRMSRDKAFDNSMLMGLDKAGKDIVLVEGPFDYLTPDCAGIKNFVSLCGSNLWDSHIEKLIHHKVKIINLLLDNDPAGIEGRLSTIKKLANDNIEVFIVPPEKLGESKDPDEFVRKHGATAIKNILDAKEHGFRYLARDITKHCNTSDIRNDHALVTAFDEANKFEQKITNPLRLLPMSFFWEEFIAQTGIENGVVDQCRQSLQEKKNNAALERSLQEAIKLSEQGKHDEARELTLKAADIIKTNKNSSGAFQIIFINERPEKFLLTDAPPMPSLITMTNRGIRSIFIPRGIVGSVVGAGGIGKTHWLTQLALSIATGKLFLGEYSPTEIGHVALILGENSSDDMHRLLRKTTKGFFDEIYSHEIEQQITNAGYRIAPMSVMGMNASFLDNNGVPSPFYNQFMSELIKNEPDDGWSLIILDPISRFLGADAETDNAKATLFISLLENMNQKLKGNPTILFGHHMNKSARGQENTDASASRGASGLTDGVRWQLNLDPVKDEREYVTMNVTKSNHTAYPPARILKKDELGHMKILGEGEHTAFLAAQKTNEAKKNDATSKGKSPKQDESTYTLAPKQKSFMTVLAKS